MSEAEAQRAVLLLKHGSLFQVDAGHVINLEQPALFVDTLRRFFLTQSGK
jgi:pimeloyl-ACP methyl ester carboxylesterase